MKFVQPIRDWDKLEEVEMILKKQSMRDWFLFVMGINTGLRVSDLLELKVKDVKGKSHVSLVEEKTDKVKRFRLNEDIQEVIKEYVKGMDDEEWLFPSQKQEERPIDRVQAYRILNKAAKKAGLEEIGTHTMRKTFGYHFYKATKDVALLQELFNHSAPSVTLRYIGINQDVMDKAIDNFTLGSIKKRKRA